MKFNIEKNVKSNMKKDKINIILQFNSENKEIEKFIKYLEKYNNSVLVQKDYSLKEIFYSDIIFFFSKDKSNYCQTSKDTYKIKSRLYEVERLSSDFIRISRNCIINIEHIKKFDVSKTGKIQVILDNEISMEVSRRRIRDVLDFFDERMI